MSRLKSLRWIWVGALLVGAQAAHAQMLGLSEGEGPGRPQAAGTRLTFVCLASDGRIGTVYGTDVYTAESAVCAAAIHAGVLKPFQAGAVTIVFGSGARSFQGSARNGVTTRSYGPWDYTYTFARDGEPGGISWRTVWNKVPVDFNEPVHVQCPSGGRLDGALWGTGVYTRDSVICVAAVHAGAITAERGGSIVVTRARHTGEFAASTSNGVSSQRYGPFRDAFTVAAAGRTRAAPPASAVAFTGASCDDAAAVEAAFGSLRAGVTQQYDTLTRDAQQDTAKRDLLASQRARLLGELEEFQQQYLRTACGAAPSSLVTGLALPASPGTGVAPPGRGVAAAAGAGPAPSAAGAATPVVRDRPISGSAVATAGGASPTLVATETAAPGGATQSPAGAAAAGGQSVALGDASASNPTPFSCTLAAPVMQRQLGTPGAAYLVWSQVTGATGYSVSRSDLGLLTPQPITATEFKHSAPLEQQTTYRYIVAAIHAQGCGERTVDIQPQPVPVPTIRRVFAHGGDLATRKGHVTIEWRMAHTDATGFVVIGPGVPNGVEVAANGSGVHSVEIGGLAPGTHTWIVAPYWETPLGRQVDPDRGAQARATVGFYRVQINAFQAEHETFDNQTSSDGRYDEIYVGSAAYVNRTLSKIAISAIHGDVSVPQAGRIQAGTGSATGGIQTGNIVPYSTNPGYNPMGPGQTAYLDRFPLLAWEGWLGGDSTVEISPSIWEHDGDLTAFNEWQTLMIGQCEDAGPLRELADEQDDSGSSGSTNPQFQDEIRKYEQDTKFLNSSSLSNLERQIMLMQSEDRTAGRDERLIRMERADADASREDLQVENACPDAKESLPDFLLPLTLITGQGKDRYIGEISRTPLLRFSTAAPFDSRNLQFADGSSVMPLLGVYRIWFTFFPI
jgi:hypothetical protein